MKKGDVCEAHIEEMRYPNKGRARVDDVTVTIKNALPGQRVQFRVQKKHEAKAEGRLLSVLEPSPLESDATCCALYPDCGGCLMLSLPYEEQLRIKEAQIKTLLAEVAEPETVFDAIIPSPDVYAYRNKMEFTFGDTTPGGPLTIGLHKRNSRYDVLDVKDCRLIHPDMQKVLDATRTYCAARQFKPYHRGKHEGFLRHLLLRRSATNGSLLVFLVTTNEETENFSAWAEALLKLPLSGKISGIFHGINNSLADVVRAEETRCLFGEDSIEEEVLGLRFRISAFSFFQTNTFGAAALYRRVRDYLTAAYPLRDEKPVLYDLYSGTGTIGQILSPVAKKVYGIELVEEAVAAANTNTALNGITNCSFICGDVLRKIDDLPERPDFIVLDPPRDGLHPKALQKLLDFEVENMIYISCKATSFVRDMHLLRAHGWKLSRVCPVDLFPHTQHVECVVLLSRAEAK